MIEPSRRHGFFDPRFSGKPSHGDRPAPAGPISPDQLPPRLTWDAFSESLFPQRRRHDFEVQKTYEAYRNGVSEAAQPAIDPALPSLVGSV